MSKRRPYQYSELPQEDGPIAGGDDVSPKPGDEDFIDSQYTVPKPKVPYKAIGLAMFLCVCGTVWIALFDYSQKVILYLNQLDFTYPGDPDCIRIYTREVLGPNVAAFYSGILNVSAWLLSRENSLLVFYETPRLQLRPNSRVLTQHLLDNNFIGNIYFLNIHLQKHV